MAKRSSAKPKDKSVFDIKVAAAHADDWLTLAVSADSTLSDLHVGILGALEYRGSFREVENIYQFIINEAVFANGRGSRTALRRLLTAGDLVSYSCDPVGLALKCTVESLYQVTTRRNYPKVIADSDGSVGHGLMLGTTLAQCAMRREYRFDEPPIPKSRAGSTELLTPAYEHGFLTAVAIGPMMMPSAWLGRFTGNLPDLGMARSLLERVMNRYNDILRCVRDGPEAFRDQVAEQCKDNADGVAFCDWARGFLEAMSLRGDDWLALAKNVEFKEAIQPIMLAIDIATSDEKRSWLEDDRLRRNLTATLGLSAVLVADMIRAQTASMDREPVRRSTPKRSPNAPCACGSGKKQKRCCGV